MEKPLTESNIDWMVAGKSLDNLVNMLVFNGLFPLTFSTDWECAGFLMEKLETLATRFKTADGFTHLDCAHFADHGACVENRWGDEQSELDFEPWSFHIHLGIVGEGSGCPEHWGSGEEFFCARGATGPEAISRAAIKAFTPYLERTSDETPF